jgi:uncharacterized protein (TIGR04255 family)
MLVFNSCSKYADRTDVPLHLPEPDQARLPRAPLDLVVCQLRFEARPQVGDAALALAVQASLGGEDRYPRLDQVQAQAFNVVVGPGVASALGQTPTGTGWRLQSPDARWGVSLMPDHVALETTEYTDWDEFRDRMVALLDATAEHVAPGIEQRLGLRYIDRIGEVDAQTPRDWEPYVTRELLGLVCHDALGPVVTAARQQLLLDLGEGFSCTFTHGLLPDEGERLSYLLDYDLSREGGRPFDPAGVLAALEILHTDALKLFQASVTDELIGVFRDPVEA